MYKYRALVTEIINTETIKVAVDLGFGCVINTEFRLAGIDFNDFKSVKNSEKEKLFNKKVSELLLNKEVLLKSLKADSGRYLAFLYLDNKEKSINDTLVELGLAKAYSKKLNSEK